MSNNNPRLITEYKMSEAIAQSDITDSDLSDQTLMVIDDLQSNLEVMKSLFELQYNVVIFDNASDAIKYAQNEDVELVLLDVNMPSMHGYDACIEFKSNILTSHIPIIFVTGRNTVESETKGLSLGAVDYIIKPVNLDILRVKVRSHMEQAYFRKQLEIASTVDSLTGVANRRQIDMVLQQYQLSAARFSNCIAYMMMDIDDFKAYNDTYGHGAGDECLKLVAQSLQSGCRETDFVGRYGGEEFVMVLPDTDLEGALVMANKILREVRSLNIENKHASAINKVTISIGLAVFNGMHNHKTQHTAESLLKLADEQLYKAKETGKNRVSHCIASQ